MYKRQRARARARLGLPWPPDGRHLEDANLFQERVGREAQVIPPELFDWTEHAPRASSDAAEADGPVPPAVATVSGRKRSPSGPGRSQCAICNSAPGMPRSFGRRDVHVANLPLLKRFVTPSGMLKPRKQTKLCATCQRSVARVVKCAVQTGMICETQGWDVVNTIGFPTHRQKQLVAKTV